MAITFLHNIVEPNGKSVKDNNLAIVHDIPLGALVEIIYKDEFEEDESTFGLRLFVVNHSRDCDGTPLYDLSFNKKAHEEYQEADEFLKTGRFDSDHEDRLVRWDRDRLDGSIMRSYSRESLKVIIQ